MTFRSARKVLVAGLLSLTWLLFPGGGVAAGYDRVVVFGDSLTDPGNAFVLVGAVAAPPFQLVPDRPYARGGLHFSNGATWVEQLAEALGLGRTAGPAWRKPGVFSNYAVGGARARTVEPPEPLPSESPDLTDQVGRFLFDVKNAAPPQALYVVHIGGNDVRDALAALAHDPSFARSIAIVSGAIDAIKAEITALADAGAHTFLVPNAPDLALVPAVRLLGPAAQAAAEFLTTTFNDFLEDALSRLEARVRIFRLNVAEFITDVVNRHDDFGLSNADSPCLIFVPVAGELTNIPPYFCARPDQFLFWDGIHPTHAGHAILAGKALEVLTAP